LLLQDHFGNFPGSGTNDIFAGQWFLGGHSGMAQQTVHIDKNELIYQGPLIGMKETKPKEEAAKKPAAAETSGWKKPTERR